MALLHRTGGMQHSHFPAQQAGQKFADPIGLNRDRGQKIPPGKPRDRPTLLTRLVQMQGGIGGQILNAMQSIDPVFACKNTGHDGGIPGSRPPIGRVPPGSGGDHPHPVQHQHCLPVSLHQIQPGLIQFHAVRVQATAHDVHGLEHHLTLKLSLPLAQPQRLDLLPAIAIRPGGRAVCFQNRDFQALVPRQKWLSLANF